MINAISPEMLSVSAVSERGPGKPGLWGRGLLGWEGQAVRVRPGGGGARPSHACPSAQGLLWRGAGRGEVNGLHRPQLPPLWSEGLRGGVTCPPC